MHPDRFIAIGMTALIAFSLPIMSGMAATSETPVSNDEQSAPPETGLTTLSFETLDKDGNNMIIRDEFEKQGLTDALFTTMDTDNDGMLSRAEFDAHGPVMKALQ